MDFKHTNLPIELKPKLVRDKIPEIIKINEGIDIKQRTLNEKEYVECLFNKVREESEELFLSLKEGDWKEELADILELVYAILKVKKTTFKSLESLRLEKRSKRGGFDKRILMISK